MHYPSKFLMWSVKATLALAVIALAGCETEVTADSFCLTTSCEREQAALIQRQIEAYDHATCNNYGLERGTPAYADCRIRLMEGRKDRWNERATGAMQMLWGGSP